MKNKYHHERRHVLSQTNTYCPKCGSSHIGVDYFTNKHTCHACNQIWTDGLYVLVEYPEQIGENIGYPSFNSDDNGARYIPEFDYIRIIHKTPDSCKYFYPLTWPDSQSYLGQEICEPIIADEKALIDFGPSALWVPLSLIKN